MIIAILALKIKIMHKIIFLFSCLTYTFSYAQNNTTISTFIEKWENSEIYLLKIADAMPAASYSFAPTEHQMSFGEQLIHISDNINWLGNTYFNAEEISSLPKNSDKDQIIAYLKTSFSNVSIAIANTSSEELIQEIDFFAGAKSKLQILNLLQDHVSHHRGQLIVYLNIKNITPPKYVGW